MLEVVDRVIEKYRHQGIIKAGELLLSPADAIDLVCDLEVQGIPILGVDCWYYVGQDLAEDPNSLDLSGLKDSQNGANIAKEFIANQLSSKTAFVSLISIAIIAINSKLLLFTNRLMEGLPNPGILLRVLR